MVLFRHFSLPFNPDICCSDPRVNVIGEPRRSPGNPGIGAAPRVQKFNLQNWERKIGRRHCPVVERVGGFNKLTNSNAYWAITAPLVTASDFGKLGV